MISVSQNTKLYILCPANRVTGGTELAHQLVDYLIFNRKDAYIVYYNQNNLVYKILRPSKRDKIKS